MSETSSVGNLESDNEDLASNNAEEEEDNPNENINAEPGASDGQISEPSKVVKPKKIIRNPQPKLNADTLRGPKGLVALESIFKDVKFKGPGHEEEDLSHLMKTYEYWCNRLFPKYPFDECISKIEKLGSKKIVQTYVKKIRLGMLDEDHNENDVIEENKEVTERDGWDEIFDSLNKEPLTSIQVQQSEPVFQQICTSNIEEEIVLSEEIKERIRRNQEQAKKIREEKLKNSQLQSSNSSEMNISHVENMQIINAREYQSDMENNVMNLDVMETDCAAIEAEKESISCESNIKEATVGSLTNNTVTISNVENIEKINTREYQCDTENNVMNSDIMKTDYIVTESEKESISGESNIKEATFNSLVKDIIQPTNSEGNLNENKEASHNNFNETVNMVITD